MNHEVRFVSLCKIETWYEIVTSRSIDSATAIVTPPKKESNNKIVTNTTNELGWKIVTLFVNETWKSIKYHEAELNHYGR